MRSQDIKTDGTPYYLGQRGKVRVIEKNIERGIGGYRGRKARADGIRVEFLGRNDEVVEMKYGTHLTSRDITREWSDDDERRRQRNYAATDRNKEIVDMLLKRGYHGLNVSVRPSDAALDAEHGGFRITLSTNESDMTQRILDLIESQEIINDGKSQ